MSPLKRTKPLRARKGLTKVNRKRKARLSEEQYGTKEWPLSREVVDRFWRYVVLRGSDCWVWIGPLVKGPSLTYGYVGIKRRQVLAHRLSWSIHNDRAIPEGMWVLHSCDTPTCTNPEHLRLGTRADNIRDQMKRGRAIGGIKYKLAEADCKRIAELWESGKTAVEIATLFPVGRSRIHQVVHEYGGTGRRRRQLPKKNPKRRARLWERNFGGHSTWIRQMRCLICEKLGQEQGTTTAAAHAKARGMGGCGGDKKTLVPLCQFHHREQHRIGPDSFDAKYEIDLLAKASELWQQNNGPAP